MFSSRSMLGIADRTPCLQPAGKNLLYIREKSEKGKANADGFLGLRVWQQQTLTHYIVATRTTNRTLLSAPKMLTDQTHFFDEHLIQKVDEE